MWFTASLLPGLRVPRGAWSPVGLAGLAFVVAQGTGV